MVKYNDVDITLCREILIEKISEKKLDIENYIDKMILDLLNIIYGKGGSFTSDNISRFSEIYLDSKLYSSLISKLY